MIDFVRGTVKSFIDQIIVCQDMIIMMVWKPANFKATK